MSWNSRKVLNQTSKTENITSRVDEAGNSLVAVENKILQQRVLEVKINPGTNVVNAPSPSPVEFKVEGRTLYNLLGERGNGTSFFDWERAGNTNLTGEIKFHERNPLKFVATGGISRMFKELNTDKHKFYLFSAFVYIDSHSSADFGLRISDTTGTGWDRSVYEYADMKKLKTWQRLDLPFTDRNSVRLYLGSFGISPYLHVAYGSDLSLYEISEREYEEILTLSKREIEERYPYTDKMTHVNNPVFESGSRNLIPPYANNLAVEPYKYVVPLNRANEGSFFIPILPNQLLSFTATIEGELEEGTFNFTSRFVETLNGGDLNSGQLGSFALRDGAGRYELSGYSPPNAHFIRIYFWRSTDYRGGELTVINPILNYGNPRPFEEYKSELVTFKDVELASMKSGTTDLLHKKENQYFVRENVGKVQDLGELDWIHHSASSGIKSFRASNLPGMIPRSTELEITGRMNDILTAEQNSTSLNTYFIGAENFVLTLPNSLTGFGESQPSNLEIRDFFRKNRYSLVYKRDTPLDIPVTVEGNLTVNDQENTVRAGSGVVVREKANFVIGSNADWNFTSVSSTLAKYKVKKVLAVYEDGKPFRNYVIRLNDRTHGNERVLILKNDFNEQAEYSVTYEVYESNFSIVPLSSELLLQGSIRSTLNSLTSNQNDVQSKLSINSTQLYDLLLRLRAGGK